MSNTCVATTSFPKFSLPATEHFRSFLVPLEDASSFRFWQCIINIGGKEPAGTERTESWLGEAHWTTANFCQQPSTQHVITWPDPSPSLRFVLRMAPECFPLRITLWVLYSCVYFARNVNVHLFLQTLQCKRMNILNIGESVWVKA